MKENYLIRRIKRLKNTIFGLFCTIGDVGKDFKVIFLQSATCEKTVQVSFVELETCEKQCKSPLSNRRLEKHVVSTFCPIGNGEKEIKVSFVQSES